MGVESDDEDLLDGRSACEIFGNGQTCLGQTYDDLILLPGCIDFGVNDVCLDTKFTKNIRLRLPVVSSPMDTVTESKMAIGMALHGGIGVIHRNNTIDDQAAEVRKVKKFRSGFISDPVCVSPEMNLEELHQLGTKCSFKDFPVTSDGKMGSTLIGLVTKRDRQFVDRAAWRTTQVSQVMTEAAKLVTAEDGIQLSQANEILKKSLKGKIPIISKSGNLCALVAASDIRKEDEFPLATKDDKGCLRVAAAVGHGQQEQERARRLVQAGVDAIIVDSRQGDSTFQYDMVRFLKTEFPQLEVIAGNVVTEKQAKHLIDLGADGLRVGMGIGSISSTQEVCACGRAQASAVFTLARFGRSSGVPVIADGGISNPGHISKALSIGASSVMCGSLLAGTSESPGEFIWSEGVRLKRYRGMNSIDVQPGGKRGLFDDNCGTRNPQRSSMKVARGVSGTVAEKGSLTQYLPYLAQSMKHGFQDMGARSVEILHGMLHGKKLRFEIRSAAAQREGGVHGLHSFERKLFA